MKSRYSPWRWSCVTCKAYVQLLEPSARFAVDVRVCEQCGQMLWLDPGRGFVRLDCGSYNNLPHPVKVALIRLVVSVKLRKQYPNWNWSKL